jgi:hypothetical protein
MHEPPSMQIRQGTNNSGDPFLPTIASSIPARPEESAFLGRTKSLLDSSEVR